jgi:hypothetical protein
MTGAKKFHKLNRVARFLFHSAYAYEPTGGNTEKAKIRYFLTQIMMSVVMLSVLGFLKFKNIIFVLLRPKFTVTI